MLGGNILHNRNGEQLHSERSRSCFIARARGRRLLFVLPLTIIGIWFPRPAAIGLVICGLLTEITAIVKGDTRGTVLFFLIFIVPDALIALYLWGFCSERVTNI